MNLTSGHVVDQLDQLGLCCWKLVATFFPSVGVQESLYCYTEN